MSQQHGSALFLGFLNVGGASTATFALSGNPAVGGFSPSWLAYGWVPSESKTLSAVKVFASAVGGTLAGTDLVCDIYSDTAGTGPNASLASSSTVTATPTGAAWVEFTGFSLAMTAGTQYWIVLRNANATPGTNFPTYRQLAGNSFVGVGSGGDSAGIWGSGVVKTSVNSGAAWSTTQNGYAAGWRVQYSDGTYDGLPFSLSTFLTGANAVFGKQGIGVQFVTPPNAVLKVIGAQMCAAKASTPGPAVFKLYNGTTLLSTSNQIPTGNWPNARSPVVMFPVADRPSLTIQPGTTVNLLLCDTTTADTNTTNYGPLAYTVDNDANSFALMPFEGTLRKVLTTDYTAGTPTFVTDQTTVFPFALILDSTGEFGASGGGIVVLSSNVLI